MSSAIAPPLEMGVIRDARRRQRRRRVATGLICAAAVALVLAVRPQLAPSGSHPASGVPQHLIPAAAAFSQAPYMGVACPIANSIACDRVGLAVWLRAPARAVSAVLGGRTFPLDWHGDQPPRYALRRPHRAFDGYLQPADLRRWVHPDVGTLWLGENQPAPVVWFRIVEPNGRVVFTREPVSLNAGWG